jgi:hypothetical protein
MPNWCENNLTFSGDEEVIKRIKNWYDEYQQSGKMDVGLFEFFYPMPKELELTTSPSPERNQTLIEKYGSDNWYDWRCNNWGTKWDVSEIIIEDKDEDFLWLSFNTPWCPPIKFYEKFTKDYPAVDVHANYYEQGLGLAGTFDSESGDSNLSITGVQKDCLKIYKDTYNDSVSKDAFEQRLEKIYKDNSPLRNDLCFSQFFDQFYFEENFEDEEFCKEYNIQPKKVSQ